VSTGPKDEKTIIDVIERLVGGVQVWPRTSQRQERTAQPTTSPKEDSKPEPSESVDPNPNSDPFSG
jgi:hypothetical protein